MLTYFCYRCGTEEPVRNEPHVCKQQQPRITPELAKKIAAEIVLEIDTNLYELKDDIAAIVERVGNE